MNLMFWKNRKPDKISTSVTKERLFKWREELIKSASAIRVLERISCHYLMACADPKSDVQRIFGKAWDEQLDNQSALWGTIGDIEFILKEKYGLTLMNAMAMQDLQMRELDAELNDAKGLESHG